MQKKLDTDIAVASISNCSLHGGDVVVFLGGVRVVPGGSTLLRGPSAGGAAANQTHQPVDAAVPSVLLPTTLLLTRSMYSGGQESMRAATLLDMLKRDNVIADARTHLRALILVVNGDYIDRPSHGWNKCGSTLR